MGGLALAKQKKRHNLRPGTSDNRAREGSATSTTSGCWPRHITRARSRHVLDRDALRVDERDARRPQDVGDGWVVAGELVSMCETNRIIINDEGSAQP